ncbi:MAG: threonine--tRNA ligase, partial [Mycoplasmatales bacterium]
NITLREIASEISTSLAKSCVCGKVNGEYYDMNNPITVDANIILVTDKDEFFEILNHSSAHIMAQAVKNLFPHAKFGVGPAIEEGFYYDIDANNDIKEEDLCRIEKEMQRIAAQAFDFSSKTISYEEAKDIFKDDEYKLFLIEKIKATGQQISIYTQGNFTDLCRGTHIDNTKRLKHFKLLNIAGAYWLGDSNNIMLQRIYGTAWNTKEELEKHLNVLQERKDSDHRKLGKELELFTFTQETGAGLPIWLPNGAAIRYQLEKFIKDEELRRGYSHVYTPVLGTKLLYETSGHWAHYSDDMFKPIEMDNETFVLRPMCCPHHAMVYKNTPKSYRDLPVRIAELGGMFRYESSGALTGLERVRNMCLNDAHLFVRKDQIKEEFLAVLDLALFAVDKLELDINYYRLSLRDPNNKEKYFDDDDMWNNAEKTLRDTLLEAGIDFIEAEDEAAFYGPKL